MRLRTPAKILAGLAMVVLMGVGAGILRSRPRAGDLAKPPRANRDVPRTLTGFARLDGTPYLTAELISKPEQGSGSLPIMSDAGYRPRLVHNIVVFDPADRTFRRILPDNDRIISAAVGIPSNQLDRFRSHHADDPRSLSVPGETQAETGPARWLLLAVVKTDDDRDGRLDADDLHTVSVCDVSGLRHVELIDGVRTILGATLLDPQTLALIHEKADGSRALAEIDLPGRSVRSTNPLPTLGPDVR